MKFLLPLIFFTFLCITTDAQPNRYAVSSIPAELKKNAHSVVRDERHEFEVKAPGKARLKVIQVITILDEAARHELVFNQFSDKFHSLGDVRIQVYDAAGLPMSKYEKKDLHAESNWQELVPNGKNNYLRIPVSGFPVTVEFEYEILFNGLFSYPSYFLQEAGQSVERSEYILKIPTDMEVRYKPMNTDIQPVISEEKKYRAYTWTISELKARSYDAGSGPFRNSFPWVMIAPTKFELDGYAGDMGSWKDMGLWYNSLVKEDNKLSPEFRQDIIAIASKGNNDREKIKLVYDYLQNNFRYVSIQLGIGGYKPFSADFVHQKKYGDCKALSNYVQACLDALHIKSYSAWIRAGSDEHVVVDAGFPYDPFNHQILCVPMGKDSVWLECTSRVSDVGFLGSFTDDREALLLTESGGVLVRTPKSKAADHLFIFNAVINLAGDGSGSADVQLQSSGDFKTDLLYVANEKKDVQKEFFVNSLDFINPDEFKFMVDKNDRLALTTVNITAEKIPDFATGNKMFLNPRIHKLWTLVLPKTENRKQDYYFEHPLILTDTTVYNLPQGFVPEILPHSKELQFEYGSFTSAYRFDENKKAIITTARLELDEYKIPVARFPDAKKFFDEVLAEYAEKIIIKHL